MSDIISDRLTVHGVNWEGGSGVGRAILDEGDKGLSVQFHRVSERNGVAAIASGAPPFVGKDFVRMFRPAEHKLQIIDREATEWDKARFPRQWEAYQRNQEQIPDGYPLHILFPHEPDMVDRCKACRIHTVEQLAGVSDGAASALGMGGNILIERARKFLETAGTNDRFVAQQERIDSQQAIIDQMQRELADLRKEKAA